MLATCFMERGDLRRAVRHLRQAVRLYHELGDFPGQASANNNLGMCYHLQGTLDAALYYYQVALHTDERVGDLVDAAIVQSNIGEVLLTLGRIEEAVQSLSAVVRVHQQGGGLAAVAGLSHINLSRCQLVMDDLDASERHLRRAKRLLREVGAEVLLLEAELQQSELLLARGRAAAQLSRWRGTCYDPARRARARLLTFVARRRSFAAWALNSNSEKPSASGREQPDATHAAGSRGLPGRRVIGAGRPRSVLTGARRK
jgi:tetratricopeptide (TPR) repeat protein